RVPCSFELPASRPLFGRGHNVDCENPDEHPSCTRALHSRAERQGWRCKTYLFFLSNALLVEDKRMPHLRSHNISSPRGTRTKCAASRREHRVSCSGLRTRSRSRASAQPGRSRYQENCSYVITSIPNRRGPQQRARWDEADGRSSLICCAGSGRAVSWE